LAVELEAYLFNGLEVSSAAAVTEVAKLSFFVSLQCLGSGVLNRGSRGDAAA